MAVNSEDSQRKKAEFTAKVTTFNENLATTYKVTDMTQRRPFFYASAFHVRRTPPKEANNSSRPQ
jgi:hypothetical protein